MKKLSLVLTLAALALPQLGQAGWWRTYGGDGYDVGNCVQITSDGNYIISGQKDFNLYILKVDTTGMVIWEKTYGRSDTRIGRWIEETSDGGYIISPRTPSLLKIDAQGDSMWAKDYGFNSHCVQETSDGGFIFTSEYEELLLVRTNSLGDTLWTKRHSEPGNTYNVGYFIQITSDGGYIITGATVYSDEYEDWSDLWLIKTDSLGNKMWSKVYGNNTISEGHCVIQTSDGGYIVTGLAPGGLWLLKTDSLGDTVWTKIYNTPPGGEGYSVREVQENGYIVVGTMEAVLAAYQSGLRDFLFLRTDADGDSLWTRVYGDDEGSEIGYCVQQTEDNGYIATGVRQGDLYLLKTDSLGLLCISEEPIIETRGNWVVSNSVGSQIILYYSNESQGFHAVVFDALGRKVDELHSSSQSGTIIWGSGYNTGVYFIKENGIKNAHTERVVLVH